MASFFSHAGELGYRLESDEQVRGWLEELVQKAEQARAAVDLIDPDVAGGAKDKARKSEVFLVRLGAAQGAILLAHRLGKIDDGAAEALNMRALVLMVSTTVDVGAIGRRRR